MRINLQELMTKVKFNLTRGVMITLKRILQQDCKRIDYTRIMKFYFPKFTFKINVEQVKQHNLH